MNAPKCYGLLLLKWTEIEDMMRTLQLPYDLTMEIQRATYTLSDFLAAGSKCVGN